MKRSVKNHVIGFSSFAACIILFAVAINPFFQLIDDWSLALRGVAAFVYLLTAICITVFISVPRILYGDHYSHLECVAEHNEIPLDLVYAQDPREAWDFIFYWNRPRFMVLSDGSIVADTSTKEEDTPHASGTRSISSIPPEPSAHAV